MAESPDDKPVEIEIDPEMVVFIITKAREYDEEVAPVEDEDEPDEDDEDEILEEFPENATTAELKAAIDDLSEDAAVDVVAMVWIGRGDFTAAEWEEAREQARERSQGSTASYLMAIPDLGDLLEEGFTQLGYSPEEYEIGRL